MRTYSIIGLLGIVLALAITPAYYFAERDPNTILAQDVYGIDRAVRSLTPHVKAYTSAGGFGASLINGLPVAVGVLKIHVANRKAYIDALISPHLEEGPSLKVVDAVEGSVAVSIPAAVSALIEKKAEFSSAGLRYVVLVTLKVLKYDHDSLSNTVKPKLRGPAKVVLRGDAGVKAVDDAIDEGKGEEQQEEQKEQQEQQEEQEEQEKQEEQEA
ncbi:hypothetical protein DV736_g264, partial [Chaetothyriales sp. CBS 134916]